MIRKIKERIHRLFKPTVKVRININFIGRDEWKLLVDEYGLTDKVFKARIEDDHIAIKDLKFKKEEVIFIK